LVNASRVKMELIATNALHQYSEWFEAFTLTSALEPRQRLTNSCWKWFEESYRQYHDEWWMPER
jgi:hypothetical protein